MPVLGNPNHERFAQALAKGKTADRAYVEAGYKPSRPHASRLATKGNVAARVAEILGRAADRIELSVSGLSQRLLSVADIAYESAVDRDDDGALMKSSTKHLNVVRATLMDVAKLNGLIVDKTEHSVSVTLEELVRQSFTSLPFTPDET